MVKNAINDQDQDHQKGKDTTEVGHDICKVHLSIMVKNAVKSQDQDHQKGKDTREVGHTLSKVHLTMMLKNAVNNQDQKKRYKRSRSHCVKSPFDYDAKNVENNWDQDHQKGKDTKEDSKTK